MLPGLDDLATKTSAANEAADPTSFLLADHAWLRDVIDAYRPLASAANRLSEVREAITDLKPLLDLHIRREEDAFFPAIEPFMIESGQGSTFDMYGEHDAIRIRLEQLLGALGQGVGAGSAYAAFSRSLLVHFENEEELIFAEAPQHLTHESCRDILKRFEELAQSSEA
jgi:hypothetical protein